MATKKRKPDPKVLEFLETPEGEELFKKLVAEAFAKAMLKLSKNGSIRLDKLQAPQKKRKPRKRS